MNQRKLESFLNKNFSGKKAEDGIIIYDFDVHSFLILGEGILSFYCKGEDFDFNVEDITDIKIVGDRLNIDYWFTPSVEKTFSINIANAEDYFITEKFSEAVFRIDVDDPRIKRLFVRAVDQGSALRSVSDQYPGMAIVGISKFSESNGRNDSYTPVSREAINEVFHAYSEPDIGREVRLGIDWTMSTLFGSNWPSLV